MSKKIVTPVVLTTAQEEVLSTIRYSEPYGVYLTQDEKKTALRLVAKGLAIKYGQNTFRISAAGSKVIRTGNYKTVR